MMSQIQPSPNPYLKKIVAALDEQISLLRSYNFQTLTQTKDLMANTDKLLNLRITALKTCYPDMHY